MSDTKITTHTDAYGHEQSAVRTSGKFSTKDDRDGAAAPLPSDADSDATPEELRAYHRDARRQALASVAGSEAALAETKKYWAGDTNAIEAIEKNIATGRADFRRHRDAAEQMSLVNAFEQASEMVPEGVGSIEFRQARGVVDGDPRGAALEIIGTDGEDNGISIFLAPEDEDEADDFRLESFDADHFSVQRTGDGNEWNITAVLADGRQATTRVTPFQQDEWVSPTDEDSAA